MKKIKYVIPFIIVLLLTFSNIGYAEQLNTGLSTVKIENVESQSNTYILLKDDEDYDNYEIRYLINSIEPNAIKITAEYNNYPNQLENTNQTVKINETDYIKIKVLDDISIVWLERTNINKELLGDTNNDMNPSIYIAKIVDNNMELMDLKEIKTVSYGYKSRMNGGNSVFRKAAIYDAFTSELTDITQDKANEEKELLNSKKEALDKKEQRIEVIRKIAFILVCIAIPILAGLITEVIVKVVRKNKN